eukprot:scaffold733_cov267-Pinguiococcus_pyrenoidosus.AAC.11
MKRSCTARCSRFRSLVFLLGLLHCLRRTIPGKLAAVLPPVLGFVAMGLQHTPANMGFYMIGLINDVSDLTWKEVFAYNLIPASLGNIVGGTVMVATIFFYVFVAHDDDLWDTDEMVHLDFETAAVAQEDSKSADTDSEVESAV